jgi:ketosteroid isomerase-like protein
VDIGGKEDFIQSGAKRKIPVSILKRFRRSQIYYSGLGNRFPQGANMKHVFFFLAMTVFLILFAAAPSQTNAAIGASNPATSAAPEPAALEKELRDADLDFARQTAARRPDGWMDFFADDASVIHDGQTVTGKDALRAFYQPVFANRDFTLTWSPNHAEASKDGTLGYTYGEYEARNGTAISRGIYSTVWRKVDGRWKVVLDLGSAARAQPKPQN